MDEKWMAAALIEARRAAQKGEVPVGCVMVRDGKIVSRAHNLKETLADPTAHAEILCLKKAAKKLGGWNLSRAVLYATLEPCLMCAGAMVEARLKQACFGARDPRSRAYKWLKKNRVKIKSGVLKEECGKLLKDFFRDLRK
ncbi:nucleoside deaminase [Candidatus Saganbacteria bacterium]|nr:nucleoside deaminase [Candidatus Saganbacteria bacterium]